MKRIVCILIIALLAITKTYSQIVASKSGDNGLMGFVDTEGNWVVPPKYDYTYWEGEQKIGEFQIKSISEDARGMIDETGKEIYPIGKHKDYYRDSDVLTGELLNYVELTDLTGKKGVGDMNGKVFVPCLYDEIYVSTMNTSIHYIQVTLNGKSGFLTIKGKQIFPCEYERFYVNENGYITVIDLNDKKGVFTNDGKQVTPLSFDQAFAREKFIDTYLFLGNDTLQGRYSYEGKEVVPCKYKTVIDRFEEGVFLVADANNKMGVYDIKGNVLIPCSEFDKIQTSGKGLLTVMKDNKWGVYGNGKLLIPCQYDAAIYFENDVARVKKDGEMKLIKNPLKDGAQILVADNTSTSRKKKAGGPAISRYPAPNSDVDKNIPEAKVSSDNTFAFIIANENYSDAPVPYSLNDGRMFKEYCQKALGIPAKNINLYEDATFGNIITAVEKMKQIADAYDGEASVIFYYAGHGFPDEKQSTAYLLPIDGNASDITTTGYSLAKFYQELSQMKLKSSIVFLDACFSGAKREDQMLSQARGVAIKVKEETPQGNMLVFSAAQGDETAHQMEEKHHGLFTYYLLKELQATSGDVDMGTLTDYVTKQVKRQSVVINNKKQTPTVIPSQALTDNWRNMKLR